MNKVGAPGNPEPLYVEAFQGTPTWSASYNYYPMLPTSFLETLC